MNEQEMNQFMNEFLIPRLEGFGKMLEEAGVEFYRTLSDEMVPGLMFRLAAEEEEIFATFLQVADEEEEEPALLRLSNGNDGDPFEQRWAVPVSAVRNAADLRTVVAMFENGAAERLFPPIPEGAESAEDTQEDVALTAERESSLDAEASQEGGTLTAEAAAILPRLYRLSDGLAEEEVFQTGAIPEAIPFIQIIDGELLMTISYEPTEDPEAFLFTIRTDLPVDDDVTDEELAQICAEFNYNQSFVHASATDEPFPVYQGEEEEGRFLSLMSAVPELNGQPPVEEELFAIGLFADAAEELMGE